VLHRKFRKLSYTDRGNLGVKAVPVIIQHGRRVACNVLERREGRGRRSSLIHLRVFAAGRLPLAD
jgi:hypothetical protein